MFFFNFIELFDRIGRITNEIDSYLEGINQLIRIINTIDK